jgi:hypothetical protein
VLPAAWSPPNDRQRKADPAAPHHTFDFDCADDHDVVAAGDAGSSACDTYDGDVLALEGAGDASCESCIALRHRVAVAERQAKEKTWAVTRALELGDAMAALAEENARLQRELTTALLKLESTTANAAVLATRASRSAAAAPAVAAVAPCAPCLVHAEEAARAEVEAAERAASYAIDSCVAAATEPWHFSGAQCAELEEEHMWREDVAARDAQLRELLHRANQVNAVALDAAAQRAAAARWHDKYRALKVAGKAHVEELEAVQDENLRRTRVAYLRCNPNMGAAASLFQRLERAHRGARRAAVGAAAARKAVWVLQRDVELVKDDVRAGLRALGEEVDRALRSLLPRVWKPVRSVRNSSPNPRPTAFR